MILKRNKKGMEMSMSLLVTIITVLLILGLIIFFISTNIVPGMKSLTSCEEKKDAGYYCDQNCNSGDRRAPELRCSEEGKICCRGKTNK